MFTVILVHFLTKVVSIIKYTPLLSDDILRMCAISYLLQVNACFSTVLTHTN